MGIPEQPARAARAVHAPARRILRVKRLRVISPPPFGRKPRSVHAPAPGKHLSERLWKHPYGGRFQASPHLYYRAFRGAREGKVVSKYERAFRDFDRLVMFTSFSWSFGLRAGRRAAGASVRERFALRAAQALGEGRQAPVADHGEERDDDENENGGSGHDSLLSKMSGTVGVRIKRNPGCLKTVSISRGTRASTIRRFPRTAKPRLRDRSRVSRRKCQQKADAESENTFLRTPCGKHRVTAR